MSVWITGGAGFIGSALAKQLNTNGIKDILIIDDLTNGEKFANLKKIEYLEFLDIEDFLKKLDTNSLDKPHCIFHQGAITDTMERNGKLMFKHNYTFSIKLFNWATEKEIPFIYASSAAVYGLNETCMENHLYENPINIYGYSKLAFDNYVRKKINDLTSQVVGLRYFNVYGHGEEHKGKMSSSIFQFYNQYQKNKKIKLFGDYLNFDKGTQCRDFIYVDDVVNTVLWFYKNINISGIFNLGTGRVASFNEIARVIIGNHIPVDDQIFNKTIEYVKFPEELIGRYQSYTLANMDSIKKFGFENKFLNVEQGIAKYIKKLKNDQE